MTKMNQAPPGLNDGNYLLHLGRTQGPELTPYSAQSTVRRPLASIPKVDAHLTSFPGVLL